MVTIGEAILGDWSPQPSNSAAVSGRKAKRKLERCRKGARPPFSFCEEGGVGATILAAEHDGKGTGPERPEAERSFVRRGGLRMTLKTLTSPRRKRFGSKDLRARGIDHRGTLSYKRTLDAAFVGPRDTAGIDSVSETRIRAPAIRNVAEMWVAHLR